MNSATEVFESLRADHPSTVAGYRVAARLGAGGMGRVYLSHTQGGRPVVIKVVRPDLADDPASGGGSAARWRPPGWSGARTRPS